MSQLIAFFASSGTAVVAVGLALIAAIVAVFTGLHAVKQTAVTQQQMANLQEGVRQRANADKAKAAVDATSDADVTAELHRDFNRPG